MAFYIDFSGGGADFPTWQAAGDFTITFRYVLGTQTNDTIAASSLNTQNFFGKFGSVFSVKLANNKVDTDITVSAGQELIGSITRTGSSVDVVVNGQTFTYTQTGTVSLNTIGKNASVGPTDGDFYYLTLDNGTDIRDYESDGVGLPDNDATNPQNATLTGAFSFVEYGGAPSITIEEAARNNFVYQRDAASSRSLSFDVNYTGTPTSLEYRILNANDDTTAIQNWQTFDAAPSGGVSTLNFTTAASLTPMHVEVRHGSDVGVTALQVNDWWVGDNILVFGQSLANFFSSTFSISSPPAGYFQFDGESSIVPTTGAGALALAQEIIDSSACAVCLLNAAVSGSSLTGVWLNEGGSTYTNMIADIDTMTGGENKIAFAWWHQGTADSKLGIDSATYQSGLNTLFSRVRAIVSGYTSTLDIIMAQLGRYVVNADCSDESHQAIREGQEAYINSDANAYGINFFPRALSDGVHGTSGAYQALAGEMAAVYYGVRGDITLTPLSVSSASYNDTAKNIYITFNQPLNELASAYSTEGVRVTANGVPLTITAFTRTSPTEAEINYTGTASGSVNLQISYGRGSTSNELTYPSTSAKTLPSGNSYNLTSLATTSQSVAVSSTLNISVSGIPDGTYKTYLIDQSDSIVYNANATYAGGSVTLSGLAVPAGTALEGYVIDNESPHANGAVITGVTV